MKLNRTGAVQAPFSFKVGCMGFFGGFVKANVFSHPIYLNISLPTFSSAAPNSKITRTVCFPRLSLILGVLGARHITKVTQSVVASDAINVIYEMVWPNAINIKPSQPVHQVRASFYPRKQIPLAVTRSNDSPDVMDFVPWVSSKYPCCLVVCEKLSQFFDAKCTSRLSFWYRFISEIKQVFNPVISVVTVPVADSVGAASIDVYPRKTVSVIGHPVNRDVNVACITDSPGNLTVDRSTTTDKPCKQTTEGVIVKKFLQAICANIGSSHDTVPSLIGQRPARADNTGWPCHFNMAVS